MHWFLLHEVLVLRRSRVKGEGGGGGWLVKGGGRLEKAEHILNMNMWDRGSYVEYGGGDIFNMRDRRERMC